MTNQAKLLTVLIGLLCIMVPPRAEAAERCADLFEPRLEGELHNPAARALMILRIQEMLPAGVHKVRMKTVGPAAGKTPEAQGIEQTLGVSYSSKDGSMLLRLGSTYLLAGTPLRNDAPIQLLDNQNIVVSGSVRQGDINTVVGESLRESRVEFSVSPNGVSYGAIIIKVNEVTTVRSIYGKSPTSYRNAFELEVL